TDKHAPSPVQRPVGSDVSFDAIGLVLQALSEQQGTAIARTPVRAARRQRPNSCSARARVVITSLTQVKQVFNLPAAHRLAPSSRGEVRTAPKARPGRAGLPSLRRCLCRPWALRRGPPTGA